MKTQKTALVTGAVSGIGREFTEILAGNKYNLVLVDKHQDKCEQLKDHLEGKHDVHVTLFVEDLTEPHAPFKIHNTLTERNVEIDVLVNNAGIGVFGRFSETEWQHEANLLRLNVITLTHLTKLFMADMVERKRGKILNVASIGGFQAVPLQSVYSASKAYVLSFTEAIASELKGTGVTATALCPGPTATGFFDAHKAQGLNIYNEQKIATAREVAEHGYKAMMEGKHVSIHGFMNALMINLSRLIPRKLLTTLAHKKMEGHLNGK